MDVDEVALLTTTLLKTMTTATGPELAAALDDLGWPDMLAGYPDVVVPLVFRLLGETGAHAPLLNDVIRADPPPPLAPPQRTEGRLPNAQRNEGRLHNGRRTEGVLRLPYAGGAWVVWEREGHGGGLDQELPLRRVAAGSAVPLAAGRRALGWWLVGTGRAMLALARRHVLDRTQFGRPLASFQAVRHRLAEAHVAVEGAEATLALASDDLGSLLAKAAAGAAALTAARHCQQVLGGIGFTAEHALHRHVRRALVLDGLLGSTRELTREAGTLVRERGSAPRLTHL
ncbi:acyl-CoA dehydrogenase family protein [Actinophytocola oryzae]|uniref:Acyl-CoA dehydrogenase-like protein n=1 Tax=Actinophytocola oryzae TaxID=502181 RepID=A0A4R7VK56_9PSEU|nr:acyl-CoA dehydrogenase family protein [Actinophytocola oryzae]TDV49832.1 acyl-CoA dehydrogenase-like protein [Actinophytocola oryzae]